MLTTVYHNNNLDSLIKAQQYKDGSFKIIYGAEVHDKLTYHEAAHILGECIFHASACAGKLNNELL